MEQDLTKLHAKLEKYMKEHINSSDLQKKLSFEFIKLQKFMQDYSIEFYSEDVGMKYLKFREEPSNSRMIKNCKFRMDSRYVDLINGMLQEIWIIKKSKKDYNEILPTQLGPLLFNFLNKYAVERRLDIKTRRNYYIALEKFCHRMEEKNLSSLSEISSEAILTFISSVETGKDHAAIILRALLRYLYNKKLISYSTTHILDGVKVRKTIKSTSHYSLEEILCIESSVNRKYAMGKRDYAMMLLATRLGIRSSDIRFLQFSNIDWDNNLIVFEQYKTKNKIELPLLIDVGEAIIDYIKNGRAKSDSKYIFLRGNAPYIPMTEGGLNVIINKYFQKANIDYSKKKHGPHSLRHSLATNLLNNGTALPIIADTLGHQSSGTTMHYLHISIKNLLKCTLDVPNVNIDFYSQKGKGLSWIR
ncbi:site-specific integrase [Chryseobacterium sp. JUb7]|uniref:site-specific integrase n=1 Tax=Chryseobacterium sp. JUb7 TaxID=2940599 RepID=UPI00216A4583|nr:site-specific integrase [Chryseobacterium sp. JUb7]MCS3530008.1 site-specific recombinase XerD [Chryseobacterium sp. JUb7]